MKMSQFVRAPPHTYRTHTLEMSLTQVPKHSQSKENKIDVTTKQFEWLETLKREANDGKTGGSAKKNWWRSRQCLWRMDHLNRRGIPETEDATFRIPNPHDVFFSFPPLCSSLYRNDRCGTMRCVCVCWEEWTRRCRVGSDKNVWMSSERHRDS